MPGYQDFLIACADTLVDSLRVNPGQDYIKDIFYKVDDSMITETYDFIIKNLPLYLKAEDYEHFDSLLSHDDIRAALMQNKKDL